MIAACCDVSLCLKARDDKKWHILSGGSSTHQLDEKSKTLPKKYYSIEKNHVPWRACYEHIFVARDISFLGEPHKTRARASVATGARR